MKNRVTGVVLILEITAICVLHALKINQAAPSDTNKSAQKTITPQQKEVFLRQLAFNK